MGNVPIQLRSRSSTPTRVEQHQAPSIWTKLPREISENILLYVKLDSPTAIFRLALVSKAFYGSLQRNEIWRPLVKKRWPQVNTSIPVKSWYKFYVKRCRVLKSHSPSIMDYASIGVEKLKHRCSSTSLYYSDPQIPDAVPIENCAQETCPILWEKLQRTSREGKRICVHCSKSVFLVDNEDDIRNHTQSGHLISYRPAPQIDSSWMLGHAYYDWSQGSGVKF